MEKGYKNLGYFLLLLIPIAFLGFYKSYFSQIPNFSEKITGVFHYHVGIASIWVLMLIVQPLFIINKRHDLHRLMGKASYIVFPLLILSFLFLLYKNFTSDKPRPDTNAIGDIILLVLFYGLAMYNRKRSIAKHMRYMIGSATVFLDPTLGRIYILLLGIPPIIAINLVYVTVFLIIGTLIYFDKKNGKDYTPYKYILWAWLGHYLLVVAPIFLMKHG
jgi:hypothetical protein